MQGTSKLWYTQPAENWCEALPLGNGRIGAMVFGGISSEKLALNEDTLWSGFPRRYTRQSAPASIEKAANLVRQKRLLEAQNLIEQEVTCNYSEAYMPLGDLTLDFIGINEQNASDYKRVLDLENGICTTEFTVAGVRYTREVFISHPDQCMVMRLSSSVSGMLSFDLRLDTQLRMLEQSLLEADDAHSCEMTLRGRCPSHADPGYKNSENPITYIDIPGEKGIRFCALVDVRISDGDCGRGADCICVRDSSAVEIRFAVRSSYAGFNKLPELEGRNCELESRQDLTKALALDYSVLKDRHISDFSALMDRCDLYLEKQPDDIDTRARLVRFAETQSDPCLYELLFQYGRYLTVSGSRPGTQATNLQGIWNDSVTPPWSSNYTVNINTEMNYWPAEGTNLSEMTEPLFDLIDKMHATGKNTAKDFYAANGTAAHHNADLWGHTTPVGEQRNGCMVWAFWPMSFGWMCHHLMDHYFYTNDTVFLKERALPCLRDAAEFYCDAVRDNGRGYKAIMPATSPENTFYYGDHIHVSGSSSSTMQDAIMREVFQNYLKVLAILGISEPLSQRVEKTLGCITPYQIGSKGQLLEWAEEYEEHEPTHRHQSHLYGLYPASQITEATPELMNACRRSLELRGDDGTGWSLGWKINLWSRLNDGDHALKLLKMQLRMVQISKTTYTKGGGSYPNLLCAHPPFQIDGNFGATSGISEMLLRSREGEITLLPALPSEWPNGAITGMKAMGNIDVDIRFSEGKLAYARLYAPEKPATPMHVLYQGHEIACISEAGETIL